MAALIASGAAGAVGAALLFLTRRKKGKDSVIEERSTTSSAGGGAAAYETRKAVDEYLQFHFGADSDILPYANGPKVGAPGRDNQTPPCTHTALNCRLFHALWCHAPSYLLSVLLPCAHRRRCGSLPAAPSCARSTAKPCGTSPERAGRRWRWMSAVRWAEPRLSWPGCLTTSSA